MRQLYITYKVYLTAKKIKELKKNNGNEEEMADAIVEHMNYTHSLFYSVCLSPFWIRKLNPLSSELAKKFQDKIGIPDIVMFPLIIIVYNFIPEFLIDNAWRCLEDQTFI